jgi:excinuclease ABC subunit A
MYILDEPTTGLHFADIQRLLEVLDRLVEAGNSVVVIEHNLDVIKVSDRLIDLGPEGGDEGGQVIATGTPEDVAAGAAGSGSHTGRFLSGMLEVKATRGRRPAARSNGSKAKAPANGAKNGKARVNGSANGSGARRRAGAGKR